MNITLQRTLRKLNKKKIFSECEYSNVYPTGSKITRLYGTPRIHKSFSPGSVPPLRPSVSSIDTFIINSLNILVLYFHHLSPQAMQKKTVLLL